MATFEVPLSGNVNQAIWTAFMSPLNDQYGSISVNLGVSSNPELEKQLLAEVGSYGKQLGRMSDALAVLVKHFRPKKPLSTKDEKALDALRSMLDDIARIKKAHRTPATHEG